MENGKNTTQSPNGAPNGEAKIGRVLERARQERGLSLEEAERATKIRKRYLVGLEQDDYTVLPDAVYARGFLKTYANFLGLDGGQLSEEVRTHRKPRRERGINYQAPKSDFEKPIIAPGGMRGTGDRRFPVSTVVTIVLAVAILAALIGALYYVGRGALTEAEREGDPSSPAREQPQESREVAARDEEPRQTQETAAPGGGGQVENAAPLDALTVRINVEGAPAWILVRADAETVYEQIAQPGFSQTFEAERRVSIRAGDAGAVSAQVNGQNVGALGGEGEVLTRNFTLKNAS